MEGTRKRHQAEEKPKDLGEGPMSHESENPEILVTRNKDSLLTLLHRPAREEGEAAGEPEFKGEHGSGFVNEGVRVEDMDSMQKATEVHSSLALHCRGKRDAVMSRLAWKSKTDAGRSLALRDGRHAMQGPTGEEGTDEIVRLTGP